MGIKKQTKILTVAIWEAKPNKLFTEEQRQMVRFLCFNRSVPCRECGKRKRTMWTMLCEFYAYTMEGPGLTLATPEKKHPPLAAVCDDHLLGPAWPADEKTPKSTGSATAGGVLDQDRGGN